MTDLFKSTADQVDLNHDQIGKSRVFIVPNVHRQIFPRNDLAFFLDQIGQNIQLQSLKFNLTMIHSDGPRDDIQYNPVACQCGDMGKTVPPNECFGAGFQFNERIGFPQIVISSRTKTLHTLFERMSSGRSESERLRRAA